MSQVGPKRRAARLAKQQTMFIAARLMGVKHLTPFTIARPSAERLRVLENLLNAYRK